MRAVFLTLAALAGLGLTGAVAVVALGLYNVSAVSGHLPGVSWVLHTTFQNSVWLRAPSEEKVPELDDAELIALGAGHYATACVPCHGAPGQEASATMQAMVPAPPHMGEAVVHWEPNELFWIVENGVKMTGMPGWPAEERDDEVWAVVAYLVSMQEEAAPKLADAGPGDEPEAYCASCHGEIGGQMPRLDIQSAAYLEEQLQAYLSGKRPSGIMAQAVTSVPEERLGELARHFAETSDEAGGDPVADPELAAEGEALARAGTRDVPTCLSCHGEREDGRRKGPVLDGQRRAFLEVQLTLWRDGVYAYDKLMHAAARDLSDDEIAALAAYFAGR
ncbi:cytochrome C [Roseovarius sp. HI0049]|nr:cytochrome C [Roseovarius sp. HI0049]